MHVRSFCFATINLSLFFAVLVAVAVAVAYAPYYYWKRGGYGGEKQ